MAMPTMTFDTAMKRLEEIVAQLEEGQLPLEDSMKLYEEGGRLTSVCANKLEQAEQKLVTLDEVLAKESGRSADEED